MKKINLAFYINFNHKKWLGGLNIILNLANYLADNQIKLKHKLNIILITRDNEIKKDFRISNKIKIIQSREIIEMNLFKRVLDKVYLLFFGKTLILERFLKKHNINYLSHTNLATGNNSFCRSLVWIPDFQYIHLPHLFSLKYKIFKKINIFLYSRYSYKIILSSNDAKKDLDKISNIQKNKVFISKFVFLVKNPKNLPKKSYLLKKYKIRKKYIYLPNQYWVHKNHISVLKALKNISLKDLNKYKIQIVSTGQESDYRDNNHFKNLMSFIQKNKLNKFFNYLGLIKYDEVLSLIYNAKCILNPSLFEGWSSTVEQAKSYDKLLLLSNIGVHKEQNPKYCNYFNPKNYKRLSKLILNIYKSKNHYKQKLDFKITEKKLNNKIFKYTKDFCKIIK